MLEYNWPGNIRELKNFCENLVITNNHITEETITNAIINKVVSKQPKKADRNLQVLMEIDLRCIILPQQNYIIYFENTKP